MEGVSAIESLLVTVVAVDCALRLLLLLLLP
jgi:hypothetical protein